MPAEDYFPTRWESHSVEQIPSAFEDCTAMVEVKLHDEGLRRIGFRIS